MLATQTPYRTDRIRALAALALATLPPAPPLDSAILLDSDEWDDPCPLDALIRANAECPLSPDDVGALRRLAVGKSHGVDIGGGTTAIWRVQ